MNTTDTRQLRHGDYAIVRYTHGDAEELAQVHRPDGDEGSVFWSYLGTDWIDSASQVTVVRRVRLVPEEPG